MCNCTEDFTGKTCEEEGKKIIFAKHQMTWRQRKSYQYSFVVHPCDKGKGPCENDGVCEKDGDGFKCKCDEDFTGDKCEEKGKRKKTLTIKQTISLWEKYWNLVRL